MYDFLKLDCQGAFWRYWLDNPTLDFPLEISERTGEVLDKSRTAKINNIEFKIIPSETNKGHYHCQISGSLHKFHNAGRHNANDFKFDDFIGEIHKIASKYDAKPEKTVVKSFEYGINIKLPPDLSCKQVIESLVSMPTKRFSQMNMKNVKFGKMASFTDHDLKFYDKSGQLSDNELFNREIKLKSNILRIEIRVNKTRFLEQKRIALKQPGNPLLLADLMQRSFAQRMGEVLTEMVSQVIYYEKIDTHNLTRNQERKLLSLMSGNYWENLNNQQRYRAKQQLDELLKKCKHNQISAYILKATIDKINEMLASSGKNSIQKHQPAAPINTTKTPYKCRVQMSHPDKKEKKQKTKRYCATCGRDITHQREGSKYCSEKIYGTAGKRCRNVSLYQQRATKGKLRISQENNQLLLLYTKTPTGITINTTDHRHMTLTVDQLNKMDWNNRRKINEITIEGITLTKSRAKKLIKKIRHDNKHQ